MTYGFARVGVFAISLALLTSCAAVDRNAGRTVEYNRQAEQAQEQMLLLNIVRAIYRRPMEFSAISTISDAASSQTTGMLQIPFGQPPNSSGRNVQLGETLTNTPTTTVNVLDTQEFYDGLMNPIPPQIIDLYLQARYPREWMMDLLIGRIDIDACSESASASVDFANYPSIDIQFDLFQTIVEFFIQRGLRTQAVTTPTMMGPPLSGNALAEHADWIASAAYAGLKVNKYDPSQHAKVNCKDTAASSADTKTKNSADQKLIPKKDDDRYEIDKIDNGYRFYFTKSLDSKQCIASENISSGSSSNAAPTITTDKAQLLGGTSSRSTLSITKPCVQTLVLNLAQVVDDDCLRMTNERTLDGEHLCDGISREKTCYKYIYDRYVQSISGTANPFSNAASACNTYVVNLVNNALGGNLGETSISISFYPRSTEAIIYYLGEIARRNINPDYERAPKIVEVRPDGSSESSLPCGVGDAKDSSCVPLLDLERGDNGFISTSYDGASYSISNAKSQSYPSLEIAKQLFALNLKGKDLPSTTVLSVIGTP